MSWSRRWYCYWATGETFWSLVEARYGRFASSARWVTWGHFNCPTYSALSKIVHAHRAHNLCLSPWHLCSRLFSLHLYFLILNCQSIVAITWSCPTSSVVLWPARARLPVRRGLGLGTGLPPLMQFFYNCSQVACHWWSLRINLNSLKIILVLNWRTFGLHFSI